MLHKRMKVLFLNNAKRILRKHFLKIFLRDPLRNSASGLCFSSIKHRLLLQCAFSRRMYNFMRLRRPLLL